MAEATLSQPLTLNPTQATKLVLVSATPEFAAGVMHITFDMFAANGTLIERRTITADGAAVKTWVANAEATIYTRLLAKLGVNGVVT